jgi:hypothetical protein
MPFHQVDYQPDRSASPDYLIVFQCGFILRHYGVAPTGRNTITTPASGTSRHDRNRRGAGNWRGTNHVRFAGRYPLSTFSAL